MGSTQSVKVTATSSANAAATASSMVTVTPPITVSVAPSSVSVTTGGQTQQFTATVANASNAAVTWSINPAVGSISSAGLYTAPGSLTTAQTVTVTATSVASPTSTGSATIYLSAAVTVSVSPSPVSITTGGQTQQFTTMVANASNAAVTWSINPAVGSISSAGLYTAPASITTAQTVTVTATSVASPTSTGSATINLGPPVTVSVSPSPVSITAGGGTQQFTATVSNASNTAVTWSINPAVGGISSTGLYIAPPSITTAQTVTVTATSVANPAKTGSATVNLSPSVTVSVSPSPVTITTGSQTQQFTATVSNTSNTAVTWSINPAVGGISSTGLYIAPPSITTAQTVTVTATSAALATATGSATVNLTPPLTVTVSPSQVSINTGGGTQLFSATVAASSNTAVTWSINPALGSISSAGLYTAPASITTAQAVTVTATSVANSTKTGSATVNLSPPVTVSVSPSPVSITTGGQTQQFTATVGNTSNTAVTWSSTPRWVRSRRRDCIPLPRPSPPRRPSR